MRNGKVVSHPLFYGCIVTSSNPVLTTEGVNPETLKDKVVDRLGRQSNSGVTP